MKGRRPRAPGVADRRERLAHGRERFNDLAHGGSLRRASSALLLVLVFTFPWQGTVTGLGVSALSKLVGVACIGLGLVAIIVEGRRSRLADFQLLVIGFAIWTAASVFWTIGQELTYTSALAMAQLAAFVLLAHEFSPGPAGARWLARAFVAGTVIVMVQVFMVQFSGDKLRNSRVRIGGLQPNDVAFMFCLAIPLAWYLGTRRGGLAAWPYRLYPVAALFAILLTGSRSGLIVGFLACAIVPWTLVSGNPRKAASLLVVVAISLPLVVPLLPTEQVGRVATTAQELESGTLNDRVFLWKAAWGVWSDNVLFGVGAGASRREIYERTGFRLGAHNVELSIMAELGSVGLLLFLLVSLSAFYRGLRTRGNERRLAVVLVGVLVVGLQVRHWEYEKPLWAVLAILSALGVRIADPRVDADGDESALQTSEAVTEPDASEAPGSPADRRESSPVQPDLPGVARDGDLVTVGGTRERRAGAVETRS